MRGEGRGEQGGVVEGDAGVVIDGDVIEGSIGEMAAMFGLSAGEIERQAIMLSQDRTTGQDRSAGLA